MPAPRSLIRLIRVCCVLVALGYGGWWLYDYLFRPGEVRRRVHEALTEKFEGVDVEIGSARMRPFLGGINVTDLKLIRRDDPTRTPFLHVPHAVIWHDKAEFSRRFQPGKIELDDARIRLVRGADGKWNVDGITKPSEGGGPMPVLVLKRAQVEVVNLQNGTSAVLDLKDTDLTVVNDPAKVFTIDAKGTSHPIGPFTAKARYEAGVGAMGTLELPAIVLGTDFAKLVGLVLPEAVEHLQTVSGVAAVKTKFHWDPKRAKAVDYETEVTVSNGRCTHPSLPGTLEKLSLKARSRNGDLTVESLDGRIGDSAVNVKVELDPMGDGGKLDLSADPSAILERVRKVEVTVSDLNFGPELFAKLPPRLGSLNDMFLPAGPADVTYQQSREGGTLRKKCVFRPKGMSATYRGFPHPVDRIRGTVEATLDDDAPTRFEIDLVGEGGGKPVKLKGHVVSEPEREVDLVLSGSDIALDKTLIAALPDPYPKFVRDLKATATGDFTAKIRNNARTRRDHGPDINDNEFDIRITGGSLDYKEFRYPLSELTGRLFIRTVPDTPTMRPPGPGLPPAPMETEIGSVRFTGFKALGPGGCRLSIDGGKGPEEGGMLLAMRIKGESIPLDGELFKALSQLRLNGAWNTFQPSGRMNCELDVRLHDRTGSAEFVPARDLELGMAFNGLAIKPSFFNWQMTDLAGQLSFAKGRVDLLNFRAAHGPSKITLKQVKVLLPPNGGVWADLRDLDINPAVFDRDLLAALPGGLKSACEGMEPKGSISIHANQLVIDDRADGQVPGKDVPAVAARPGATIVRAAAESPAKSLPTIYWDGTVTFKNASLKTGVTWDEMKGQFSTRGLYLGDRLGRVVGNIAIDSARVMKQPVQTVSARLEVDPRKPDVILIPWLNGKLFGGEVGGEARLELGTPLRFDLALNGSRLKLEEFARVNSLGPKTHVEGLATAQLTLSNTIDPKTKQPVLQGGGSVDVPNGRMLDLPVILDVIKLARLRPMDHTAFEEAHAVFRIRGDRLKFGQLDLLGNAISLGGEGEMNLDGTDAAFEFHTVWTNIRDLLGVTGELPSRLSGSLYKIKVTGDLGESKPKVSQEPLPIVTEPFQRLFGRSRK